MIYKKYLKELDSIKIRIENLYSGKQINPQIADDLILIAQLKYKLFLTDLFKGEFKNIVSDKSNSEFILYSYKSYYGEIPAQTSEKNKIYKRRLNLFKKGKRWSDNTGGLFYSMLDKLNDIFQDTPINLLGELCTKFSKRHIIVKIGDTPLCNSNTVTLPSDKILDKIKVNHNSEPLSVLLKNYIKKLNKKELSENGVKLGEIEKKVQDFNVQELVLTAKKNDEIKKFLKSVVTFFKLSQSDIRKYENRIIIAFFLYQFNDLDFDLNLLFPEIKAKEKLFQSVLMIATKKSRIFPNIQTEFLLEVVNKLSNLENVEKQIVERTKVTNDNYIIWKSIYEKEYDKLYSFMKSCENICFSVCRQNDIPISHTDGRVKSFESFYNKIFMRANDEIENKKFYKQHNITYVDVIKEPHIHFRKVFNIIRDLAGVRIVLLFEEDLKKIKALFKQLIDEDDLLADPEKDFKFYVQSIDDEDILKDFDKTKKRYNYRSLHITIKPGEKRLKLVEYQNLRDIQCEIQFRSVLAHAWADVNHDLAYKHRNIVKEIKPEVQTNLNIQFEKLSKYLLHNDKFLNSIRRKGSQFKLD